MQNRINASPIIDLRSDTYSKPTAEMRAAIGAADLGDDVYGHDPTVNELKAETAAILGKEAAVFVPAGTMSNQIAIRALTEPGDAILADAASHIADWESAGPAALSGFSLVRIATENGVMTPDDIAAAIYSPHRFSPQRMHAAPKLLCLENTHNSAGAVIWSREALDAAAAAGRKQGLRLHLDGARLWNPSSASGTAPADYAAPFDTVSVCFSKGLGAPVGFALAGAATVIEKARWIKHRFGGGIRLAGVIAAGALYGLRHNFDRLRDDHDRARHFAKRLGAIDSDKVDLPRVQTNIVRFRLVHADACELSERCKQHSLYILSGSPQAMRAIFHLNIDDEAAERAIAIIRDALAA